MPDPPDQSHHQSLYRRFRPQRFAEVVGQPHLVTALRNAINEDRVSHAYLLSGPRGTGKTSTARILAKALNCEQLEDGEPCGNCESCEAVAAGTSMDLIELDAASNNSVNHIREMTEKAALATAGRHKVYLLDEVHMLSTAASNALLKTLEEPPSHVVFILATTDPQKVLATIRSRAQHYELSLVSAQELAPHVRAVAEAAGRPVDELVVEHVTQRSGGSVRDALSALDTVLAAGGIPDERADAHALVEALAASDLAAALIAVAEATSAGVDARDLAERTARRLRDMFLIGAGVEPAELLPAEVARARELSETMGRRANVRALEALGGALAQMPQSADRRLTLDAALVGFGAESVLGAGPAVEAPAGPSSELPLGAPAGAAPRPGGAAGGPAAAREAMAKTTGPPALEERRPKPTPAAERTPASAPAPGVPPAAEPGPEPESPSTAKPESESGADRAASRAGQIDASEIQAEWETRVVDQLRAFSKGVFGKAQVTRREGNVVTVRLDQGVPLDHARRRCNEVEAVLSDWLDQTIRLEIDEPGQPAATQPQKARREPPPRAEPASSPESDESAPPPAATAPDESVPDSFSAETPADSRTDEPTEHGPLQPESGPDREAKTTPAQSNEEKTQLLFETFPDATVVRADQSGT